MRNAINPPNAVAVGPYSGAVSDGKFVFCSGQTPLDPDTGTLVTGGVAQQTRQCFTNLFAVLAEAGLGPADVLKVNVYLIDMNDFSEMNQAYADHFDIPYPARTTIGVSALPLGARVEIELTARVSGSL